MKVTVQEIDSPLKERGYGPNYYEWQKAINAVLKEGGFCSVRYDIINIWSGTNKFYPIRDTEKHKWFHTPPAIMEWILLYLAGYYCPTLTVDLPIDEHVREVT
jgi:hypothetical protein